MSHGSVAGMQAVGSADDGSCLTPFSIIMGLQNDGSIVTMSRLVPLTHELSCQVFGLEKNVG